MERDAIDFGTEKVSTLFKKLFFPTLLGMLGMSAMTAIDGIFIGHSVGSDGIAAVNIICPPLMLLTGLGLIGLSGRNPDFPVATNFICGTVSCLTDTNRSGCTIGSNKRKRAIP